jgi:hypothetical protein
MCRGLGPAKKGDNMWMMELLEYVDFEVKVLFELFVKLRQVHRLYGDKLTGRLK